MPRISRNEVVFRVGDDMWSAKFSHKHDEDGIKIKGRSNDHNGNPIYRTVRHITTCELGMNGNPLKLVGESPCSIHDDYNWRKGLSRALNKAMAKAGYCKFEHKDGREHVVQMRPIFGEIRQAFYRELPKRAYGPNATHKPDGTPLKDGEVIEGQIVNRTPPENLNGTAHKGMD